MKKSAEKVSLAELRVVAFGVRTQKTGGLIIDQDLTTFFLKSGLIKPNGMVGDDMFVLVVPQKDSFVELLEAKCTLMRIDGAVDTKICEGKIVRSTPEGYSIVHLQAEMGGRFWAFECDRNPRTRCGYFDSYNGTKRALEHIGFGQIFGQVVQKVAAKGDISPERKEEKSPEPPLSTLNISVPRASDVRPVVPSRTNRFEQMKTTASAKPVPAPPPAPKPAPVVVPTTSIPKPQPKLITPPVPLIQAKSVVNGHGTNSTPVKAVPAGPNPVLQNAMKHVLVGASGEMLVEVCRVRPFKPTIDQPSFKGQPRDYFDPKKLKKIANSIKKYGQKTPVSAMPVEDSGDGVVWEIIDGERRFRAISMLGLKHLKIALDVPGSKQEQHMSALIQNFCREGHTPMELSNAIADQVNAGQKLGDIADALSIRYSLVSNLHALQRLEPSLKPLLDPPTPAADRIRLQEGIMLSRIAVDQQVRIWNIAKLEKSRNLVRVKIAELGKEHVVQKRTEKPSHVSQRLERRLKILLASTSELQHWTPEELAVALGHLGPANTERFMRQLDLHITHIQDMKALFEKVKKSLLVK